MTLTIAGAPLRLSRTTGGEPVWFVAGQTFEIVPDDRHSREFRTHTLGYVYTVAPVETLERELISWHYHPYAGREDTHLHLGLEASGIGDLARMHIPSGRVAFEAVVRFLLEELLVQATREDWRDALTDAEERFREHRTWS